MQTHPTPRVVVQAALSLWLVAALGLLSACSGTPQSPPSPSYWPTQAWRTSTPEEQGFDSVRLAQALQAMRDDHINIHSLMIVAMMPCCSTLIFTPMTAKASTSWLR